ncbi:hypothetical protein [Alkalicoccobacillus plakortidis]|uniref:Uncharacterized protein n=1 Tax=Alkalicoccobacillus plakortidis TaxID=444060 RepID=A0ABT0XI62_9BACI|nr:hypothetical protein [Alkalicoccobacillus plakortidis]MCM2675601.1 hypothetical protein [Alkalicoccobacillus plakortidis]
MNEDLDRTTYFELKVKGYHDRKIMNMYGVRKRKMNDLRVEWGFIGIRTEGFQWMMIKAKVGQAYISKKVVQDGTGIGYSKSRNC